MIFLWTQTQLLWSTIFEEENSFTIFDEENVYLKKLWFLKRLRLTTEIYQIWYVLGKIKNSVKNSDFMGHKYNCLKKSNSKLCFENSLWKVLIRPGNLVNFIFPECKIVLTFDFVGRNVNIWTKKCFPRWKFVFWKRFDWTEKFTEFHNFEWNRK